MAPLEIKQINNYWCICIKDTPHNVVHNDNLTFTVYRSKEDAERAFEHIKQLRKIKYRNILRVE